LLDKFTGQPKGSVFPDPQYRDGGYRMLTQTWCLATHMSSLPSPTLSRRPSF
jgi:hypothetical protein